MNVARPISTFVSLHTALLSMSPQARRRGTIVFKTSMNAPRNAIVRIELEESEKCPVRVGCTNRPERLRGQRVSRVAVIAFEQIVETAVSDDAEAMPRQRHNSLNRLTSNQFNLIAVTPCDFDKHRIADLKIRAFGQEATKRGPVVNWSSHRETLVSDRPQSSAGPGHPSALHPRPTL